MSRCEGKVLFIGYGNPGRQDDGLGPALAAEVERLGIAGVSVDAAYQLSVEDAAAVAEHDVVVFADAAVAGPEPFEFRKLRPVRAVSFSSHSVDPRALLALAEELFGRRTPGYLLGIRGYRFNEFEESLSAGAQANLSAATAFIAPVLRDRTFDAVAEADDALSREDETCKTEST